MILSTLFCHDCHARYEHGLPADKGSDAIFFPGEPWTDESRAECPRCHGGRVSVTLVAEIDNMEGKP